MKAKMYTFHFPQTIRVIVVALLASQALLIQASYELIDDFSNPRFNHLGNARSVGKIHPNLRGIRHGWQVSNPVNTLDQGLTIGRSGEYLIEKITRNGQRLDLNGKQLRLEYTTFDPVRVTIRYLQFDANGIDVDTTSYRVQVTLDQGRTQHVDIPMSDFNGANMKMGYGFAIGSPLIVHKVGLIFGASWE